MDQICTTQKKSFYCPILSLGRPSVKIYLSLTAILGGRGSLKEYFQKFNEKNIALLRYYFMDGITFKLEADFVVVIIW